MSFDPTSAAPDEAFDPNSAAPDSAPPLALVLRAAVRENPEEAAEVSRLSKRYPIPQDVIARNLRDVKFQEAVDKIDETLKTSPKLAEYMRANSTSAKQMHDLVPELSALEQTFNVGRAAVAAVPNLIGQGISGAGVLADITARYNGVQYLSHTVRDVTGYDPAKALDVAEALKFVGGGWKLLGEAIGPAAEDANFATDVAGGIGQLAAQIYAAPIAVPLMLAQGIDASHEKSKGDNAPQVAKDLNDMAGGAITALTEKYGVDAILNRVPPAIRNNAMRWVADKLVAGGIEATQEITEGVLKDTLRVLLTNPDAKIGDGVAYEAGVAATSAGIVRAALGVRVRSNEQIRQAQDAEKAADHLKTQLDLATQALLRERNPEEFRALVGKMSADAEVFVDAGVLNQLAPEMLAQMPQSVRDQLANQVTQDTAIAVPVADVLTIAPGTPLAQFFTENARMDGPGSMSQVEAKDAGAKAQEYLTQETQRVIQQATDQQATQDSHDRVKQGVLDQLNTVGRFRKDVNEAYATWTAAFYTTMAGRQGLTPEEMQAKYPLRITGQSGQGSVLNAGKPGEMQVEGYHFSAADRSTLSTGFYGTQYAGRAKDEILNHPDKRIRQRLSFYFDKGTGVRPESGVGGRAHRVQLSGVYDADADPLKLKSGDPRAFESKLLDAGYTGYANRMDGTQPGQVIMLGEQTFTPEKLGAVSKIDTGQRVAPLETAAPQWQTQSSGEPEMLQTKLERMQSNPSWADYDLRIEGRELQARKKNDTYAQQSQVLRQDIEQAGGRVNDILQVDQLISSEEIPTITLQDLIGLDIFPTIADRTAAAAVYSGIDSSRLDVAIPLLGGPMFPLRESNVEAGVVWANRGKGVTSQKAAKLKAGANYMMVLLGDADMHQSNSTVAAAVMGTMEAWQRDGRMSAAQVEGLAKLVRSAPSSDAKVKGYLENFPGFDDPSIMHAYMDGMSFDARKRVIELLASKEAMNLGAPPMNLILDATREPSMAGHRWGDGVILLEVDQTNTQVELGTEGTTAHPDFPVGIRGRVVGKLNAPISWQVLWQDWLNANNGASPRRAFELAKPVVSVTQELIDRIGPVNQTNIGSARQARLASDFAAGNWRQTGVPVNKGGASPQEFVDAILTTAARPVLTEYSLDQVKQGAKDGSFKVFQLGADGRIFFGMKYGDPGYSADYGVNIPEITANEVALVSVVNNEQGARGIGAPAVVLKALQEGATVLDCFAVKNEKFTDGFLPEVYAAFGFEKVAEIPFAPEYYSAQKLADAVEFWKDTTPGFDPATNGFPPLVIMKWKGTDADRTDIINRYLRDGIAGVLARGASADAEGATARFDAPAGAEDAAQGSTANAQRDPGNQGSSAGARVASRARSTVQGIAALNDGELRNLGLTPADRTAVQRALGVAATDNGVLNQAGEVNGRTDSNVRGGAPGQPAGAAKQNLQRTLSGKPAAEGWARATSIRGAGGPVTVYRGANRPLSAADFDNASLGKATGRPSSGLGVWFTTGQSEASTYGDAESVQLDIRNPKKLHVDDLPGFDSIQEAVAFRNSLIAEGYDGLILQAKNLGKREMHVVAFNPEQVIRPQEDINLDNLFNQGPRGTFNPKTLELALNENADLSTFLHETGHFFLEVMADLASQPNAPADIQADMGKLMGWFGITGTDVSVDAVETIKELTPGRVYTPEELRAIDEQVSGGQAPRIAAQTLQNAGMLTDVDAKQLARVVDAVRGQANARTLLQVWNSMTLDQKRPYHERFAESFEQYLMEGKAPSLELQPLFRKFRAWMLNVYKSLKAFVDGRVDTNGIQLSDEVRQVFDRMLASEEQIAQANEVAGLLPNEDADGEAVEKLTARSLRDLKWTVNARAKEIKKLQAQAKSLRKDVQAEVTAEVNAMPEFQAKEMLDKTRKENKEQLNDTELAIIADAFQYPDVDTMLKAIDAAGKKADVIEGMTDQRMLERHGDLIDQRAIEQAANEAVHNEARAKSLATELKAQADMLNPRTDTGNVSKNGSKITVNTLVEAAKQFATNVVAKTPLRDLKNKAWQHTAAERRASKRWQEATAKGQTQEAVQAKQDQMLNNAAAKAALDAQGEMRKILDFFKRVIKDNNEKVVDKGRDPDVVNAARAVLAAYGVAPKAGKTALEYMALVEKNDPAMHAVLQPAVQGALNMAQPLDALTMDELRGLHEEIQGMWHLAKRSRQMEVDGNLMDMQDAEDELQARMQAIGVPDTMPGDAGAVTKAEERVRKLQGVRALLRRVEQWAEGMDGKFGGPFLKLVFQPVKDAADAYRADRTVYRKKYQALVDNVAPALTKGTIDAPELGYTFGKGHNGIGHAELLHAILHTGNESNKRKLLLGRKWATENEDGTLDTARWDAFLQRAHDTGVLNKVHYDFAQGVWDLLEETKPLVQKTHRDVFGRYFAEVTADSFTTPFGSYTGGYVPAQADPRIVQDADMRKLAAMENENMSFSFPSTNKGFTKGRVEYNRPLMLDLRTIGQHLDKVLLFSHMEPAVRDVNKLLSRKGVGYSLGRIDPAAYSGMLTPWLSRSARQIVETPVVGDGGISRVLSAARSRAGMALMFANVSNTIQQLTGFSLAAVKVKPSSMMAATAQFIASPKKTARAVSEASPFMANRMENEIAAINDAMNQILLDPSLYEKAQAWSQKHAYFMQTAMANTMEPIIWTGAYNDALADGQSEKDAVRFADNVIRTTQGSTLPEDVSRIETGPAYARIFTQFIGYFNMMANTNATALKQISQEIGLKRGAGKALGVVTLGLLIPIWVAEAIAQAMRGGPEDEDKDGYLDDWLAAVFGMGTIKGAFAMVPFIGQMANAGINRFNGNPADDKMSLSPAVSLLEAAVGVPVDVYKAITDPDKLNMRNATRDVASAVSLATGLPAVALARPLGYAAAVEQGKVDPTGPVDLVRGLATGTPSPQSK